MSTSNITRRQFVGGAAVAAAAAALPLASGVSTAAGAPAMVDQPALAAVMTALKASGWTPLDPVRARRTALEIYRGKYTGSYSTLFPVTASTHGQAGCCEASWWPVIEQIAEKEFAVLGTDKWAQLPKGTFSYGSGGIHGGGAVCGFYNGAMNVLKLTGASVPAVNNFHRWFENGYIPSNACYEDYRGGTWAPAAGWGGTGVPIPLNNAPKVKPMTTTCHGSLTRWKAASNSWIQAKGVGAVKDRCSKGSADGAYKLAMLINEWMSGATIDGTLDPTVGATTAGCKQAGCHTETVGVEAYPESGVGGIMKCTPCHTNRIGDGHNL